MIVTHIVYMKEFGTYALTGDMQQGQAAAAADAAMVLAQLQGIEDGRVRKQLAPLVVLLTSVTSMLSQNPPCEQTCGDDDTDGGGSGTCG